MTFASIGDSCVDTYPNSKILGGTSYNSALAARKYGANVSIVTAIGEDDNAAIYKKSFSKHSIDYSHVQVSNKQTSAVHITLDSNHSPVFGEWELGALADWQLSGGDLEFIQQHDVAKMVCLKPLVNNFEKFLQAKMPHTIKAGDFDGDSQYSFKAQDIGNYINGLDVVIKSLDVDDKDAIDFLQHLAKEKQKIILITLGKNGSVCFAGDKTYRQEAQKLNPTNTTGFGDTFIAVFLLTYFQTKDIQSSLLEATQAVINLINKTI